MSARVTTGLADDGRPVARKRSRCADDVDRLRHEAQLLSAARHPGVVELVAAGPTDDGGFEVMTTFVGAHSLETIGPLPDEQAAGTMAALAETVADLHDMGITHGRIEPSHVLLGAAGRPVLCGFSGAITGRSGDPSLDVAAIGELLRTLVLDSVAADIEPIPDRRFTFARFRRWTGYDRRGLLTIADQATADDPLRRPPARRLAATLRDAVPAAQLVRPTDGDRPDDPRRPLARRAGTWVAVVVGLGLLLYGSTKLGGGGSRRSLPVASASAPTAATTATEATEDRCVGELVALDLDHDGCPDPVHVIDDGVVTVGATRFRVGSEGDRIVLGDWDCDGVVTPAVLRPATGEVFVFTRWAGPGSDVSVKAAARVEGAVDLVAAEASAGCAVPVAVRADGSEVEVQ